MVSTIRVTQHSDMPIYRQIVAQLTLMIETGALRDGDRLPSTRLLAGNLRVNRNTVARAFAELRDQGLIESRHRGGMVVTGGEQARASSTARAQARQVLAAAARECMDLGLEPAEIEALVRHLVVGAESAHPTVSFVECNTDRAEYFAGELSQHLGLPVRPLVLGEFDAAAERPDLVLTTFFHLAEVRTLLRGPETEVVAIVVAPHVQTLVQIAQVPTDRTVGICYSTEEQAASIRDSLSDSGLTNIRLLQGTDDAQIAEVDLVVIPSELPHLRERLAGRVRVIEFGNVLDAASLRMVSDVVRDLQLARAR